MYFTWPLPVTQLRVSQTEVQCNCSAYCRHTPELAVYLWLCVHCRNTTEFNVPTLCGLCHLYRCSISETEGTLHIHFRCTADSIECICSEHCMYTLRKKWSQNISTPGAVLWHVTVQKNGRPLRVEPFWLHFFSQCNQALQLHCNCTIHIHHFSLG